MPANLNITLDSSGAGILSGGGQIFSRNDSYNFRLRVVDSGSDAYQDTVLSAPSFRLVFGTAGTVPASGQFKLTTSTGTSEAIAYNATTSAVASAVSGVAGNVTVTTFGSSGSAWLIIAATANTALSFTGVTFTLFPTSSPRVSTFLAPASGVTAVQLVELVRQPAVSAATFTAATTTGVVTLSLVQEGSSTASETYRLTLGADAVGGSYSLVYGSNATTAVSLGASSLALQTALSAVTGLGANIAVQAVSAGRGHIITFCNALALTNVTTALTLDAAGIQYAKWDEGPVTFSGLDLEQMFVESGSNTTTGLIEVEMTESGRKTTLLQATATARKDLQL